MVVAILEASRSWRDPPPRRSFAGPRPRRATPRCANLWPRARLQAVKVAGERRRPVQRDAGEKESRLHTFQDRSDKPARLRFRPTGDRGRQFRAGHDVLTDPTTSRPLETSCCPRRWRLWKSGGTKDDSRAGIAFDEYSPGPYFRSLAHRSCGVSSERRNRSSRGHRRTSGLPNSAGGRGIYFADTAGKNFFRVTVDSDVSGRLRVDKHRPGTGLSSRRDGHGS